MRLAELFKNIPMYEDFGSLPNPPPNLPSFDPKYSKVIGTFDGYDIWGSREINGYKIFGIKENDKVASYIIIEDTDEVPVRLRELWVDQSLRGKGYATILILFLLRKIKLRLLIAHDEILSSDVRGFILKALKSSKFKISDPTGKLMTDVEVEKIFKKLGKTPDEVILHEEPVRWGLFGTDGLLKEPYYVRGENLD